MRLTFVCDTVPKKAIYRCTCGTEKELYKCNVREGKTESCGCLRKELTSRKNRTHGKSRVENKTTRTYRIWKGMRQRCTNPNVPYFDRWGGRGIAICERWNSYESFLADMGECPSDEHSIDRIDNNGNYCPENCRWATQKEQCNNKSNVPLHTGFGKSQTAAQWAEEYGLPLNLVQVRLRRGFTVEQAVTIPAWAKRTPEQIREAEEYYRQLSTEPFDHFCPCI